MRTDQLIGALARDVADETGRGPWPIGARLGIAAALTIPVVAVLVTTCLPASEHLRHGLQPTASVSVAAALLLAGGAYRLAPALSRPEGRYSFARALWPAPVLLAIGIVSEMAKTPVSAWLPSLVGANPLGCFGLVTALSLPILAAALLALRSGAPSHPAQAGALAGAFAGGLCSAIYVLHCPENSLLYVAAWHAPAVLLVMALGAALGRRWLVW